MAFFDSNGIRIHYLEQGSGAPVLLIHGFASSARGNWEIPGWLDLLSRHYRVVAFDCRGHGQSDKPHAPEDYGTENMTGDALRLLDHLGIRRTLLMGYSMGAMLSLYLSLNHAGRLRAVVLGGIGGGNPSMSQPERTRGIVKALLAEDKNSLPPGVPRAFREFAESSRNDLKALAACMDRPRPQFTPELLRAVKIPVMLAVGTADNIVGSAEGLAASIPGARLVKLEGRDHINAVNDPLYREEVVKFFAAAPD